MPITSFPATSTLAMNATLTADQYRMSPNGKYKLIYQPDGNLVLYAKVDFPTWASNTHVRAAGGSTELQANGDLVVSYAGGGVAWASSRKTGWVAAPGPGSYLLVTDDNKLVVYAPNGSVLWSAVGKAVPKNYVSD